MVKIEKLFYNSKKAEQPPTGGCFLEINSNKEIIWFPLGINEKSL